MCAINGYGHYYMKTLIEEVPDSQAILVGVVDPEAQRADYYPWIIERQIPVFDRIEDFFQDGLQADLTVISSPPQYHILQAIVALSNGSNVLVDKPVGVSIELVKELIATAERFKLWVEVGYQWSFSNAIQSLKRDILDNRFGDPVLFKSICLWPRDKDYYRRNDWAGRILDSNGLAVLDSPANNACAHFLHNLLFLLGDKMGSSAIPLQIESEQYRAYNIENYDSISLRARTQNGAELLFYASHVTEKERKPEFYLEFSEGIVRFGGNSNEIIGELKNGDVKNYGSPDDDHQFKKLFYAIESVNISRPAICPPEAAIAHTICINQIQESMVPIIIFSIDSVIENEDRRWVQGLLERMSQAYDQNNLISEI